MANRRGPWSSKDRDFVSANCDTMSYKEIAQALSRDEVSVKKYIEDTLGRRIQRKDNKVTLSSGTDIEKSILWAELVKEFTDEELRLFIYHWNRIIVQFKEDVFPTEEIQIVDMIKLEILMGRALKNEKDSIDKIKLFQKEIDEENKLSEELRNFAKIQNLEQNIGVNKAAYESIHKEYAALLQRKVQMLEGLKATRSERIKRIEDSRQSFMGWMQELLNNPPMRRELGVYIEKFRIAVNVEEARLMAPHTYLDGTDDLPILTADSVSKITQDNQEE